ncbi:polysaccharide deacetylase family protein [Laceyella sacchari]|uniref:Polysaccharide deacetylase family protein n=1 Tax=Laceyella sacchari TaxID=37482 RepID=A0ABY5U374_LACSH|nr:polysaccharide deacetylase family protein [Laceyella sacchari]TCW39142.1 peptidoglycan/xylan/chitin deacetylase (PgdA/CDA1 family) [Laceyella sacchari]UWE03475.1 polysaccharide deacetylase family protein [Laceyella sacchari]
MQSSIKSLTAIISLCLATTACSGTQVTTDHSQARPTTQSTAAPTAKPSTNTAALPSVEEIKQRVQTKFEGQKPQKWGEHLPGVIDRLPTQEKLIALTFDACGGQHGSGYDASLIQYLEREQIPATLFINSRWIERNKQIFLRLARQPLFEIENHGTVHRPLSVNGRAVYGIRGTANVNEALEEVLGNDRKIMELTGKKPKFFRSGTAYYDDVAVKIIHETGERPVNFDIIGDAGATFSARQVKQALLTAKPGSIVILHFNQPQGETAEGLKQAIPLLRKQGYRFVKLEDVLK